MPDHDRKRLPYPHPKSGCYCTEGAILDYASGAVMKWLPAVHDCQYVAARNALIPVAEDAASKAGHKRNSRGWTLEYFRMMAELSAKLSATLEKAP